MDKITSQAYVRVSHIEDQGIIKIYSTDGDRMAFSKIIEKTLDQPFEFTVDPKKIQDALSGSDLSTIRLSFDSETNTIGVHVSDREDSVLSFPSMNTEDFLTFDSEIEKSSPLGEIDSEIFIMGLKFIQGFLPDEKNPKSDKYTRLYASKGILYGANGSSKIGAFHSPELKCLDDFIIRRIMINPISDMIEKSKAPRVLVSTTSKMVFITTIDKSCGFGFLRTNDAIPQYPISIETPICDGFNVQKEALIKKLNRLALSPNKGFKAKVENNNLNLSTISERVSKDSLECKALSDSPIDLSFVFDYKLMKSVLSLFQSTNVNAYIDKLKCSFISEGFLEMLDTKDRQEFKAVALICLAREIRKWTS